MKFEKKFLTEQNRCYATGSIVFNGQRIALLATEGEGACLAYSGTDYDQQQIDRFYNSSGTTKTRIFANQDFE